VIHYLKYTLSFTHRRIIKDAFKRKQMHRKIVRLPKSLFEDLTALGVDVKSDEEGLHVFCVKFGDDGWKRYSEWIDQLSDDVDPVSVSAIFAPPAAIQGTALLYPAAQIPPILNEANSIISHYGPLGRNDFAGDNIPVIPGPIAGVFGGSSYACSPCSNYRQNDSECYSAPACIISCFECSWRWKLYLHA
jgi:hypothetical protein